MNDIQQADLKARYNAAVQSFVDKIKSDINVVAVIVGGSVAYDVVWEKSDIDMTIVVRDQQLSKHSYCILEDGITINTEVVTRSGFIHRRNRDMGGSFSQSYYAKGRIVYSSDESFNEFFEEQREVGADDAAKTQLFFACVLVFFRRKCEKWLYARKDSLYAQFFLVQAAEAVAAIELLKDGQPMSREGIQKAAGLNPEMMKTVYAEPLSRRLTGSDLAQALGQLDDYIESLLDTIKRPVIEYMADGEIKTMTLLADHFHIEGHFLQGLFDYLADKGVIERVTQTIRITPKGRMNVEELGFMFIPDEA